VGVAVCRVWVHCVWWQQLLQLSACSCVRWGRFGQVVHASMYGEAQGRAPASMAAVVHAGHDRQDQVAQLPCSVLGTAW
jgi:hypothetical protein